MLYFNPDKFDFWKVYDCIKRFYPIGIRKGDNSLYYSYPGLKELEAIIVDNIHDEKKYESWKLFTKEIGVEIGKEVIGTTYGQAPSFSSFVLLEQTFLDDLTRTKELHFFVSLVGPFYTIIGADINTVKIEERYYRSTSYLVVSPENEFTEAFRLLCDRIENHFKGYRFIPFTICKETIEGLDVRYSDENLNKVFHALFNNHIELDTWRAIGDESFKLEDWVKEDYVSEGGGWTSYPSTDR